MKRIIITVFFICGFTFQSYAQEADNERTLTLAKEFMRRVFDMQPFDTLSKLTTLNKDLPKARIKYSSAYFAIVMLQLQLQKYSYSDLSYIPYLILPTNQRNLVYERFIDGKPEGIDLSTVYAVMSKEKVVTYLDIKNGVMKGIRAPLNHGGSYYLHEFSMDYLDKDTSLNKWDSMTKVDANDLEKKNGLLIAQDFIKFVHDSLADKNSTRNYIGLKQKLLVVDTLDLYTISFTIEYLKDEIIGVSYKELKVIPYTQLSKRQKRGLDVKNENENRIYAVLRNKEVITFLYLTQNKVKYFLVLKNLEGKYVFIPYGYANPQIRRT